MKVILLGANSQLGYDIIRSMPTDIELIKMTRQDLDFSNVDHITQILNTLSFDIIINCVSYNRVDEAESNASEAFLINGLILKQLSEIALTKKACLIHFSSDYIFPGNTQQALQEESPLGPISVYGASKLFGESLLINSGCNYYLFRVASLFGLAGSSSKGTNFVETMIRLGKEKGTIKVINDVTMSPTSTYLIAKNMWRMILQQVNYGIYHLVNSGEASWFEFAQQIIKSAKISAIIVPVPSHEYKTAALRPKYSVLDNKKAKNVVGGLPHWSESLDQYMKEKGYT